jgi:hypothetical protein
MQLLAAMAPPGGGRNAFSQRNLACFSTINMTNPNDQQLRRIFTTLLAAKLSDFDDEVRPLAEPLVAATVDIYRAVCRELLPTPSKSHYLFNTRDLAKIVQGVMQVGRACWLWRPCGWVAVQSCGPTWTAGTYWCHCKYAGLAAHVNLQQVDQGCLPQSLSNLV